MPTMDGFLVAFRLPKGTPNRVYTHFQKKFYGQETSSHRGKYRYRRSGLLDEIPHNKLIRGVIIIRPVDLETVVGFLNEYEAEVYIRKVELVQADIELLTPHEK